MAGWLGSNFTAQFDQIKKGVSQVSTIVKDTLVVDETWDQDDDEIDENISENPSYSREKELLRECKRLEKLHKAAVEEKESQCNSFRELLLEKENDLQEMSKMLENDESIRLIDEMKEKLIKVLVATGQEVDSESDYDLLLGKLKNFISSSSGNGDEEKERLLAVTQKLKSECLTLREKLSDMENGINESNNCSSQFEESFSNSNDISSVKQSLSDITAERDKFHLMYKNLSEESSQLKSTNDALRQEIAKSANQLLEVNQTLKNKENELGILEETNSQIQTEQYKSSEKLQEVLNKNVHLEKRLLESEEKSKSLEMEIENFKRDVSVLDNSLSAVTKENKNLEMRIKDTTCKDDVLVGLQDDLKLRLAENENHQTKISELTIQVEALKAEKQTFISQHSQLNSEIETLNKKLEKVQLNLTESNSEVQSKVSIVLSLEKQIDEKNAEIARINVINETLMQSNQSENSNLLNERNNLNDGLMKECKQRETVEAELQLFKGNFAALEEQLKQNSQCIESLKSELNQSNALNEQLGSQLNSSLSQVEKNKSLLQISEQNCQELKLQIVALESLKSETCLLNESISLDLQNLHQELNIANQKLAAAELSNSEELMVKLELALKANSSLELQHQKTVELLETENNEIQERFNSAMTQLELFSGTEEKCQETESRNNLLSQEIQLLKDASQQQSLDVANLRLENEDLTLRNSKLSSEHSTIARLQEVNEASLLSMKHKLEESSSKLANLEESMNKSSLNIQELQQELAAKDEVIHEKKKEVNDLKLKENDYQEAANSLKSINEIITKTARDNESAKVAAERTMETLQVEVEKLQKFNKDLAVKNIELSSQVDLLMSRKAELEAETIESKQRIQTLEGDMKNLVLKEETIKEEKDVDESEPAVDNNMVHVLNEKIREISQLKSENRNLFQTVASEKEAKDKLLSEIEENKITLTSMNSEALKKLSLMVRDKDLEIESLSERNKSLLEIIENEKGLEQEISDREKCLMEEIKKLKEDSMKNKDSVDHSNELLYLKGRIEELERKLTEENVNVVQQSVIEDVKVVTNNGDIETGDRPLMLRLETKSVQLESSEKEVASLNQEIRELKLSFSAKEEELLRTVEEKNLYQQKVAEMEQEVDRIRRSLLSVQGLLDEKTSNNESHQEQYLKYIAECERLSKELAQASSEKDNALAQTKAKIQETQDLRKEVSSIIEKKKRVEGEVERLRAHLVQVEEGYTVELMESEDRERELRKKVAQLEDKLRVMTHTSSEVSENASQASSQLTAALEAAASQRDKLSDQLSTCQSTLRTRNMELRNLQLALEGFQKQKENELGMVEKTCEDRVAREQKVVTELQEKLRGNKQQLDRAQQGLEAAARLSEQLDKKSSAISNLKQEISVREEMVKSLQSKMLDMTNNQVGKVDRDLVKNLVIGYATVDVSKKLEILKIIATVLDFNGDERSRTGVDGAVGGWLGGLLGGDRSRSNSVNQAPIEQNIAKAFIKFLEDESTPKSPVTLPVIEMARNKSEQLAQAASRSGKTPSPLIASASNSSLALPSLSSSQSHSPSILKSVLDENK